MNQNEYIQDRVDHQITWYSQKSDSSKSSYRKLRLTEIILAAVVTLVIGNVPEASFYFKLIAMGLSLSVVVIAGILTLYKFQEHWIEYRTTAESLKHEKYLFLSKVEPYNTDSCFPLFVHQIEALISKEHTNWISQMNSKQEKHNGQ